MCGRKIVVIKIGEEMTEKTEDSVGVLEVKTVEASNNVGERQESHVENEPIAKEEELQHDDYIKAAENPLKSMEYVSLDTRHKSSSQEDITKEQCCPVDSSVEATRVVATSVVRSPREEVVATMARLPLPEDAVRPPAPRPCRLAWLQAAVHSRVAATEVRMAARYALLERRMGREREEAVQVVRELRAAKAAEILLLVASRPVTSNSSTSTVISTAPPSSMAPSSCSSPSSPSSSVSNF